MTVTVGLKNVVVVGGSYVGLSAAQQIAALLPATHRVVLVEPHSHFHFLFAFPRFAVVPGHEHKAIIPYTFADGRHAHAATRAASVHATHVTLERAFEGSTTLPFEYLAVATGTSLRPPWNIPRGVDDKAGAVGCLQAVQSSIAAAERIVVVGGGAVGVQLATDIKEHHPAKSVTVVARALMPRYPGLHEIVAERFAELGIELVSARAEVPEAGFPDTETEVRLNNGDTLRGLVVLATGMTPNSEIIRTLPGTHLTEDDFIAVRPTMQLADTAYPHIFAVGDIAATGAHKAARPGIAQAAAVAENIAAMIAGKPAAKEIEVNPAGIHMTLGMQKNIVFRNPPPGESEPTFTWRDDGVPDMGIENVWTRRGVRVKGADDYKL